MIFYCASLIMQVLALVHYLDGKLPAAQFFVAMAILQVLTAIYFHLNSDRKNTKL